MTAPRKVATINVRDYPRRAYSAHWHIVVAGSDAEGYRWQATISSYAPRAYYWRGREHAGWPLDEKGVPVPKLPDPPQVNVNQRQYLRMPADQQAEVRHQQELWRSELARVAAANPRPLYDLEETVGVADDRDSADRAAQQWVRDRMAKYRRPRNDEAGNALALGPLDMLLELGQRLFGPLLAIAYSTAIRTARLAAMGNAIDGGSTEGLLRLYTASRPATCGTATTLLAELTATDPCLATNTGGVATFDTISPDTDANATGTAAWFRWVDSTGTCCMDGNIGTAGSDLNLDNTSINSGQEVGCSSFAVTEGNP